MLQVNVHEAKSRLSELLALVEQGEEVIIARAGKPVAMLGRPPKQARRPGYLAQYKITEDIDAADDEIAELFLNSVLEPAAP